MEEEGEIGVVTITAAPTTPVQSAPPTPVVDSLSQLPPSGPGCGGMSAPLVSIHQVFELQLPKFAPESEELNAPTNLAVDLAADAPTDATTNVGADEAPVETEASLMKLLVKDLRAKCDAMGLSQVGKKAELVQRLLAPEGAAPAEAGAEPDVPPTPAAAEPAEPPSSRRSTRRTAA